MKRLFFIIALVIGSFAGGSALYSFTTGPLMSGRLNYNLSHIHNTMVGGHGPRLVNTDVALDAGINHTKLKTPQLVPKAWGSISPCTTGASTVCTVRDSRRVASVVSDSAGTNGMYYITLSRRIRLQDSQIASHKTAMIQLNAHGSSVLCVGDFVGSSTTVAGADFKLVCYDTAGALVDAGFDFVVFEED
jgi:hypothetical protein